MVGDLWLRRRLGCAGRGRLRVVETLRERLAAEAGAPAARIGLDQGAVAALFEACGARALAGAFSGRGDGASLRRIVWWGSALGDVASVSRPDERERILREAALFNLGVALFDSVVDQASQLTRPLADALAPPLLAGRLRSSGRGPALAVEQPVLEPLVGMFDTVLTGAGVRFADDPRHVERLCRLLRRMFLSELRQSGDPFAAKLLPVVFIGALSGPSAAIARVFDPLSRLLWLWDDWLDLAEDMRSLAPNAFLGRGGAAYVGRSLARVATGRRLHPSLGVRLVQPLDTTLVAARAGGDVLHARTLAFLAQLLA